MPDRAPPPPGLDELLPPEPDDEPDDEPELPEPDPSPWALDPRADEDSAEEPEEELHDQLVLEDDRWWGDEVDAEGPEDEPTPLQAEDLLAPAFEAEEQLWEDESQALPPGRVLVGWREQVLLPEHALAIEAACYTGSAISRLNATLLGMEHTRARVALGDRELELSATEEAGVVMVDLAISLAGVAMQARLILDRDFTELPLVLGRDLLAGRFVVDPAAAGLHRPRPR